jgi:uncharacterized membrane protein
MTRQENEAMRRAKEDDRIENPSAEMPKRIPRTMPRTKEGNPMHNAHKSLLGLIVAGFFVVLPVLLAGLVLEKVYHVLQAVVHPVLEALPGTVFHNPTVRSLAVCVAVVVLLLLAGGLARVRGGQALGRGLEAGFLNRLPFYALMRNLATGIAGRDDEKSLKPTLVTVSAGKQQLGFIIERHADGSATVFLPSSPNPSSGAVQIVEASLIRELRVPAHRIFQCLHGWGHGTANVLEAGRNAKGSSVGSGQEAAPVGDGCKPA